MRQRGCASQIRVDWRSECGHESARHGARASKRHLLPHDGPESRLERIGARRGAPSRHRVDQSSEHWFDPQRFVDRNRIGIEIEQTPESLHGTRQISPVDESHSGLDVIVMCAQRSGAVTVRKREHQREALAAPRLKARNRVRSEERQQLSTRERLPSGEPKDHFSCWPSARDTSALCSKICRRRREDFTHRVVELTHAAESSGKSDVGERHRCGLDEQPRRVRAVSSGDGERSRSQLVGHHSIEVPLAVAELPGQPGNAVTFDGAVSNHPHCSADDVLSQIPFRRPRRSVGAASLACPKAPLLGCCRCVVELDVGLLRGHCGAARPAVDPRGPHRRDEHSVEPAVTAANDAVAVVVVERWHGSIMVEHRRHHQRKSATAIGV